MSKDEVKEKIVKEITGPTKATDMPLLVRTEYDIPMLLSELVKERRILKLNTFFHKCTIESKVCIFQLELK